MAEEIEKKVPLFDWEEEDFVTDDRGRVITVTGGQAAQEIALKALNTIRSTFSIYFNVEDEDLDDKYGNDTLNVIREPDLTEEARLSEVERAVRDALLYDPWFTGIENLSIKRLNGPGNYGIGADHLNGDEVEISLTLQTIFDDVTLEGVILNG
ncbi:DUF2634 domain-containing protein [Metabacillus fastidiosus]|uniref:DUF2634 domain-containing protein n=1 Tax=Metabacillus fastidiosus TaxID=1458 RepID=UPI003D28FB0E